nr:MAG TPA: Sel1-like repeat [Caudoviricetes sp.]
MGRTVKVVYHADTLQTEITVDGEPFDTSRINGKEIDVWAYPFMLRKIKWNGFYEEMVEALNGEKEFDLIFEGSEKALAELKEAWEDAPISIITQENLPLVKITYNENPLITEILIDGKVFDTSKIKDMEIEDWVYPFLVKKIKWNGIFDELAQAVGSESYVIQFVGDTQFGELLKSESPSSVIINVDGREALIIKLCIALGNKLYYMKRIKHYVCNNDEHLFEYTLPIFDFYQQKAERYVPKEFWNKYKLELLEKAKRHEQELELEWERKKSSANAEQIDYSKLAENYYYGHGVKKSSKKSLKYCKKALECNSSDELAMFIMGNFYLGADGIQKDLKEAIKWFQQSTDAGYEKAKEALQTAQYRYAKELDNEGYWEEEQGNVEKAFKLYEEAAEFGYEQSCNWLGLILSEEKRAAKFHKKIDITKAVEYFRKAAEAGLPAAMYNLGACLFYDMDEPNEAIEWLEKASKSGMEDAEKLLNEAYKFVSSQNTDTSYDPEKHQEYYYCCDSKNFEPYKEPEKNFIYSLFFYYPVKSIRDTSALFRDFNNFGKTGKGKFSNNAEYFNQIYKVASPEKLDDSDETESARARAAREITDIIVSFWGKKPVVSFLSHFLEIIKNIAEKPDDYRAKMEDTEKNENEQVIIKCSAITSKVENLLQSLRENFNANKNSIFSLFDDISKGCHYGNISIYDYYYSCNIENADKQKKSIRSSVYARLMFVVLDRIYNWAIHVLSDGLLDDNDNTSEESNEDDFFDSI